ncbi:hypothetical protein [Mycobacterium hubeiense]|uniref:hypothetical protein n=1 Tax=Mycobacterium hubeiense TaxID=1867256 RepID=UPI000C7F39C4|nr:hypothetical protein [Mycobacterium sp. QGD 101]
MSGAHSEIGPELRQLAQTILDRLDPAVRSAAAFAASGDGPGKCQQVWCPVCALAALVSGEQHPLLDVIAEHSVSLLEVIRAVLADGQPGPSGPSEPPPDEPPPAGRGRYQHIPVAIKDPEDPGQ